ncbi:MAG TPA: ABC transporter permease [bacterium]|nr:ABC transporter permease [bacterium]
MATAVAVPQEGPLRRWWRVLRVSFWLGWQIETNWTDPLLFFIYSLAKPLGGVLILVFMYFVVARGGQGPMLGFFVVGTALWPFVLRGMMGIAWGLISDREHWKTLRYIYTSPIPYRGYLIGRALAQATSAVAPAVITLIFGRYVLGVPLHLANVNVQYAAVAMITGIAGIVALGLVVVSAAMLISGEAWRMPEGVGAGLYLVSGAIFPVTTLPGPLQTLSQVFPLTWWLEAMRRGLLGPLSVRSFAWAGDAQVLAYEVVVTAVWIIVATFIFGIAERRARQLGILDQESAY